MLGGEKEHHGEKPDHPKHPEHPEQPEKPGEDTECHDEQCRGGKEHGDRDHHEEKPGHEEDTECHGRHCKRGEKHGGEKPGEKPDHHEDEHCEDEECEGKNEHGEKNGPDEYEPGGKKDHEVHEYYTTVLTSMLPPNPETPCHANFTTSKICRYLYLRREELGDLYPHHHN